MTTSPCKYGGQNDWYSYGSKTGGQLVVAGLGTNPELLPQGGCMVRDVERQDCRTKAEEARAQAAACMDPKLRAHYHQHADTWIRLCRMAEFQDTFAEWPWDHRLEPLSKDDA
ncbi:hypothetical protein [Brevundimonas naejangsanensis]